MEVFSHKHLTALDPERFIQQSLVGDLRAKRRHIVDVCEIKAKHG